jgi:tetratricopeptide (TPR) repeat protein
MRVQVLFLVMQVTTATRADERAGSARAHFTAGSQHYAEGRYEEALHEFRAGFALSGRVRFKINMGQCYRQLHDLRHAKEMYQDYLATAPESSSERLPVLELVAELDRELEKQRALEKKAVPVTLIAPAVAPPVPKKSGIRRYWWTIPVTLGLTGIAVGVGAYFGEHPCAGTPNCVEIAAR